MEQRSSFCNAFIFVILGTIIHSSSLNISSNMHLESLSLLGVYQGRVLLPTITNFLLIKVSLFFLLWGFLKVFSQIGKPIGGLIGALLIAVSPLVSYNSGYLGAFVLLLALFWWSIAFANQSTIQNGYLLPVAVLLLGSIFLTPWMFILAGVLIVFFYKQITHWGRARLAVTIITLLLVVTSLLILIVPYLQWLENYILFHEHLTWIRRFLTVGITFDFIYSWGAALLIFFAGILGIQKYPESILVFIICLCGSLFFVGFDLAGIVIVWIVFVTFIAFAFDSSWNYLYSKQLIWMCNLLVIVFVLCIFNIAPASNHSSLMKARKTYKSSFHHRCGKFVNRPEVSTDKQVVVTSATPDDNGCWVALGNYHYPLPGRYRATFYVCHEGAIDSFVDVSQGHGKAILNKIYISDVLSSSDCTQALTALKIEYNITGNLTHPVEHRVFYGNVGGLYFDRVEVEAVGVTTW